MNKLENYIAGRWVTGEGDGQQLFDAVTGEVVATATSKGLDFKSMTGYARKVGNRNLRKMTFHERGRMLKELALHLRKHLDKFYSISYKTGATKADSWVDIEGGIGNLFANASLRRRFQDLPYYVEGETIVSSKNGKFIGHHIMVPKQGIAIHINAFNFPIWGMLEKIAVNLLAGVPAIVKPATSTSFLTELVTKDIIASGILPEGSLQLICGSVGDLFEHLTGQDVVTFTGSATTGRLLKSHPSVINNSVRFNMEADSLNCSILGPESTPDTEEFKLFIKEVAKEMTVKAGHKCTAIRRTIVPENLVEDVINALSSRLKTTTIGDPAVEGVRMGPLVNKAQVKDVKEKVKQLMNACDVVYGDLDQVDVV